MTTVHDVEKLIETELASFNTSKYLGAIPKDFIANFKKALLEVAPTVHQMRVKLMKELIHKKETELTFMEVGICINVIQAAPLYILSDDLDAALIKFQKIEELRIEWNTQRGRKEQELIQKKQTMISLAGGNNNNSQKLSVVN